MATFSYRTAGGLHKTVEADHISFEPSGHVAFWASGKLVRAVYSSTCHDIEQGD